VSERVVLYPPGFVYVYDCLVPITVKPSLRCARGMGIVSRYQNSTKASKIFMLPESLKQSTPSELVRFWALFIVMNSKY
jgi:hypothetical protein